MKPFSHPAFRGKFGVAQRDITPEIGIYSRNWGAAKSDQATSIHHPLTATVLTIQEEHGGDPIVMVALDLSWWRSTVEQDILTQAVLDCGIKEGRYWLALSHTHASAVLSPGDADKPGGERILPYLHTVAAQIRAAIKEALGSASTGILETAIGSCKLATNRDMPDPDANRLLVGWNPDIVADDTLLFGRVSDDEGNCLATIVNYACHPTILAWDNTTISPDFIGEMREVLEGATDAPCLFLQGASGELAAKHQYVGDLEVADRAGRSLGHAALAIYYDMLRPGRELYYDKPVESGAPLALWSDRNRTSFPDKLTVEQVEIDLALKDTIPTFEELQQQIAACTDRVLGERLQRKLLNRKSLGDGSSLIRKHYFWHVGEILFLSISDEAYSDMQVDLRQAAGTTPLFITTVTNGGVGYISPRHSYAADSYASNCSPYAPGCYEQTLETLTSHLKKIS